MGPVGSQTSSNTPLNMPPSHTVSRPGAVLLRKKARSEKQASRISEIKNARGALSEICPPQLIRNVGANFLASHSMASLKPSHDDPSEHRAFVCWLIGCLTSHNMLYGVSQRRICSDNFSFCQTEVDVADQICYLTRSHYTDIRPTSPSADPITPGSWQGSRWSASF